MGFFFFFLVLIFEILTRELNPRKLKWPARSRLSLLAWGRAGPHPGSSSQAAVGAAPPRQARAEPRSPGHALPRPPATSPEAVPPSNLGRAGKREALGGALGSWRPRPGEEAACVLATASDTALGASPPATPP